jgi:hypothetical protein
MADGQWGCTDELTSPSGSVEKPDYSEAKIVVAMVGLPARGKSYLSNKLQRYLLVSIAPLAGPRLVANILAQQWLEYEVRFAYISLEKRPLSG